MKHQLEPLYQINLKMPQLPIQTNGDPHEPMDLDVQDNVAVDDLPTINEINLDLESYICHYHGLPRINRLEFIADHCKSLRIEALNMAINYIKEYTYNVKDYTRLFRKLQEALEERDGRSFNNTITIDMGWIETRLKQSNLRYERIDSEIKNSSSGMSKDNLRRGQDDLGDHFLDCGDIERASSAFTNSREYALTQRTQLGLCLNMIRVGLLLKNWSAVSSHVSKAEALANSEVSNSNQSHQFQPIQSVPTKLHCAAGLFELHSRKYKKAAKHFLSTNFDHFNVAANSLSGSSANLRRPNNIGFSNNGSFASNSSPSSSLNVSSSSNHHSHSDREQASHGFVGNQWDILAPVNIAVYGSLCALATYTRKELADQLINSATFKQFSELEPQLRDAVSKFYESKYAACLAILQEIKNVLLLDMYLAPHVERLYRLILNKSLIQYFEAYSTASMYKMAEAFDTSIQELENEIIGLICDGHIKARIDSHNKILYAKNTDSRTQTFERALQMGKKWQRQTRAHIAKTVISNAGLVITSNAISYSSSNNPNDMNYDFIRHCD